MVNSRDSVQYIDKNRVINVSKQYWTVIPANYFKRDVRYSHRNCLYVAISISLSYFIRKNRAKSDDNLN